MAEGFAHYGPGGCVMAAFALVDFSEEFDPFSQLDATLEHATYAAFVKLVVDDGVGLGPSLDLPGQYPVLRKLAIGQV